MILVVAKGSASGGDVSVKKELVGAQLTNPQYAHQGSFTQGINYVNSHI